MSKEKLKGDEKPLALFLFLSLPPVKKRKFLCLGADIPVQPGSNAVSDSCFLWEAAVTPAAVKSHKITNVTELIRAQEGGADANQRAAHRRPLKTTRTGERKTPNKFTLLFGLFPLFF